MLTNDIKKKSCCYEKKNYYNWLILGEKIEKKIRAFAQSKII